MKVFGPWEIDQEKIIKRKKYDVAGNYLGYELLDGEYPIKWTFSSEMTELLDEIMEDMNSIVDNQKEWGLKQTESHALQVQDKIHRLLCKISFSRQSS